MTSPVWTAPGQGLSTHSYLCLATHTLRGMCVLLGRETSTMAPAGFWSMVTALAPASYQPGFGHSFGLAQDLLFRHMSCGHWGAASWEVVCPSSYWSVCLAVEGTMTGMQHQGFCP